MALTRIRPRAAQAGNGGQRPPAVCPIPRCGYQYKVGTLGWHNHVGPIGNHPAWHPELRPADRSKAAVRRTFEERCAAFEAEFPDFFQSAHTPGRRVAPGDRHTSMGPPSRDIVPDYVHSQRATATAPPPLPGAPTVPLTTAPPLPLEVRDTVKSEPKIRLMRAPEDAEEALARALADATAAGKWDVVESILAVMKGKGPAAR